MKKNDSRKKLVGKAAISRVHQHEIAGRVLRQEIPGSIGKSTRISREQSLIGFSGLSMQTELNDDSFAPASTHVDIPDTVFFGKLKK